MRSTTTLLVAGALLFASSLAEAGTPRASSELRDDEGVRHTASKAFDGVLATGWAEGEMGDGTGSWIELPLDRTMDIESISIWPGNMSIGERSLREFGRPRLVTITLSGGEEEVVVQATLLDPGERGALRQDIEVLGQARKIRFDFPEVRAGGIYNDMFIAEIAVNFVAGGAPKTVERLNEWLESQAGQRATAKNREEVIELYDEITAAEFGDRDKLQELMDRAGDGAPYRQRQVVSLVPSGFRVHALPPDSSSVEALLKLKDSNAIPAIERAALRSRGKEARTLRGQVDIFKAYQDLVGGGRFNIPPFGTTGWEKGALQGLGEPLGVEVDVFGSVWIADVGNNRVQRFSFDGVHEKTWGHAEAGITNQWFQGTRTHYVSGSQPGTGAGEFSNPLDMALVPTKLGDWVAILDARGRVTVLDDQGALVRVIDMPAADPIIGGVGGEGHIEYLKGDKLAVIWGNEGWTYSLEGEQLSTMSFEDGSPTAAVALKNGKLGLAYGKKLVMYSTDGFRHGDLMRGALGDGFEAWDICTDNSGKHWVVTDKGQLHKLKKPGKVDYSVTLTDYSLEVPRCAVFDDIVFITDRDEIKRFDALELAARQAMEAAEAAAAGSSDDADSIE